MGLALLVITWSSARGHDFSIVEARLTVADAPAQGEPARELSFSLELIVDLDALLLGVGAGHDPERLLAAIDALPPAEQERREERLRGLFARRVRILCDGEPMPVTVLFPGRQEGGEGVVSDWARGFETKEETRFGTSALLRGDLEPGCTRVATRLSRAFGASRVSVVVGNGEAPMQLVPPGAESDEVDLANVARSGRWSSVAWRYARLGFLHIVPRGLDHLLFIVGLCLVPAAVRPATSVDGSRLSWAESLRALVVLVTTFTAAHAVTLALSIFGVVSVASAVVEPLIAASIVAVAVDAFVGGRMAQVVRVGIVFAFGLLHGLGFASVLSELGLPQGRRLLGLIAFHLGVEIAQLLVVLVVVLLLWPFASRPWYRNRVSAPIALAIAALATLWVLQRTLL